MSTATDADERFPLEWTDGEKLRKVRRYLGVTQEKFAELLEVKSSTYMAWESGRNAINDPKAIARRLKLLADVPMWWFLDTEPPTSPNGGPDGGISEPPGGFEPPPYSLRVNRQLLERPTIPAADVIPIRRIQPARPGETAPRRKAA